MVKFVQSDWLEVGALEEAFGGYTRLELPLVIGIDSVEFGTEFPFIRVCQLAFFIVLHKSVGYGSPPVFPLVVEVSG